MITKQNRWKGGRGYTKYYYTVKDIAEITGRAIGTVRNDITKSRLELADLKSVFEYILRLKVC